MPPFHYQPPRHPFVELLYRDQHIVVANKAAGLLSVRGKDPAHQDSLQQRLQWVFPELRIIHRLDMATSGLMVMALTKAAQSHISRQFQQRQVEKCYIAHVWGQPEPDEGQITLPLICDWPRRPRQKVCHEHGKPALTYWKVLERCGHYSKVALRPVTGRSHQLRVHMQAIGHPILGDRLYAHASALAAAPRLQLHAWRLHFTHPQTNQAMSFVAPLPF